MSNPKLAKRKTLEGQAPLVIEALLAGQTEQSIADQFGATKHGVQLFKARHMEELQATRAAVVEQVKDDWITDRVNRIAELQWLYETFKAEAEQHGLVTEKVMVAEDGGPIVTRDYRGAMVKEMRGILRDAATELGQIVTPKPDINIQNNIVLIREFHVVGGSDNVPLG